jgi:hypothetical protein
MPFGLAISRDACIPGSGQNIQGKFLLKGRERHQDHHPGYRKWLRMPEDSPKLSLLSPRPWLEMRGFTNILNKERIINFGE